MSETPKTWPENAWPLPEQLADWLKVCTDEERLRYTTGATVASQEAVRCFEQNHDHRLAQATARAERAEAEAAGLRARVEAALERTHRHGEHQTREAVRAALAEDGGA